MAKAAVKMLVAAHERRCEGDGSLIMPSHDRMGLALGIPICEAAPKQDEPPMTKEEADQTLADIEGVMSLGDVRQMFRLWHRVAARLGADVPAVGV